MTDAMTPALADALRDHYTIERELGRGGMATVYLARDLKHNRPVALKVLRAELGARLGAERFVREIHLTATLQHPHILPLLDSGEAAGRFFSRGHALVADFGIALAVTQAGGGRLASLSLGEVHLDATLD